MLRVIVKRLLSALPNLVGVVVITFLLTRAIPGDPAAYFAGAAATQDAVEQVRKELGLDRPLIEQFFRYVSSLAKGDLGLSLTTGQPVLNELLARLPASLEMVLLALLLACAIAIPLGVAAATKPGSWVDQFARLITTAGVSLPTFFTGLLLSYVFYFLLGWAPSPRGRLDTMFSPGLTTLFVSHDLNVVRLLTDRVAVMYLGKIVEMGVSSTVFQHPAHPYTQALLSSIPGHGPRIRLTGEVSSPINPPPHVCRFASRCPAVHDRCLREAPALHTGGGAGGDTGGSTHVAACHGASWPATAPAVLAV